MSLKDINEKIIKEIKDDETKIKVLGYISDAYQEGLQTGFTNGMKSMIEMGSNFASASVPVKKNTGTGYI